MYAYDFTFTFAILPVYQCSKSLNQTSRWLEGVDWGDSNSGSNENSSVEEDNPDISLENISYFLRTKRTIAGWDVFISLYHGHNAYFVSKREIDGFDSKYIKEIVKVFNAACGFSTTFGEFEFHWEGLYNYTYEGKDDHYLNYVLGFRYTIDDHAKLIKLDKIDIIIEYTGGNIFDEQDAEDYERSSKQIRVGKDDLIYAIIFKVNEAFKFNILTYSEIKKGGEFVQIGLSYKIIPELEFNISLEAFSREENSYYGYWDNNDRIVFSLTYSF